MKKIHGLLLSATVLLFSCGKDHSSGNNDTGAISAEIDGVKMTFNTKAKAIRGGAAGVYYLQLQGYQGMDRASDEIAMVVTDLSSISTGAYDETGNTSSTASINYIPTYTTKLYVANHSVANPVRIVITSIGAGSVQGTFTGDLYLTDGSGVATSTKKTVQNGKFNVEF